jgi:hypothetical protein
MAETADIAPANNTFLQHERVRYRERFSKQQANILRMSLPLKENVRCRQPHFPGSGKFANEKVPLCDVVDCAISKDVAWHWHAWK